MKKGLLQAIAIFEVIMGLAGMVWLLAVMAGQIPSASASTVWYGLFPLLSISAGLLLWRKWRRAVARSLLVQLLQVPIIRTEDFLLNLAAPLPLQLTISGIWNARAGVKAVVLGINFLPLGVLFALLWCESAFRGVPFADALYKRSSKRAAP